MKRFLLLSAMMICALPAAAHDDPVVHADHIRLLNEVVPEGDVTIVAVQSGPWSDPATWGGDMPNTASRALIPPGVQVVFDGQAKLRWLKIQGRLRWAHDSRMTVETIAVDTMGSLEVGRPSSPVTRAEIVFANPGGIVQDWTQLGRGLIVMGQCSIWGQEKTPWLHMADNPRRGDAELVLEAAPFNWTVGDELVIPGVLPPRAMTHPDLIAMSDPDPTFREQHEVRKVAAINGNVVRLNAPLKYDLHYQLPPGKMLAVGNLSRSVVVRSQGLRHRRRGHIMFMPPAPTEYNIGFCRLQDLGRTTATMHVTDPQIEAGVPIRRTLYNPRGRYSLHFHKMGYESHALVEGVAVTGALKWGITNHGSNVDCVDCVSFDAEGSNFNTENGTEIGSFDHNLAVYSRGIGKNNHPSAGRWIATGGRDLNYRNTPQERAIAPVGPDVGWAGYGFWLQGPLVKVTNNETYGAMHEGLAFAQSSLERDAQGKPLTIPASVVPPNLLALLDTSASDLKVSSIPHFAANNVHVGCQVGVAAYNDGTPPKAGLVSVFEGGWNGNCVESMSVFNNGQRRFERLRTYFHVNAIEPARNLNTVGLASYSEVYDTTLENCQIENYTFCVRMPEGTATITGAETLLKGIIGIHFDSVGNPDAVHHIEVGESHFQPVDQEVLEAMYPTNSHLVTQRRIGRNSNWWSNAAEIWDRPGQAPLYLYGDARAPADAFLFDGVQMPVSLTPSGGGGR